MLFAAIGELVRPRDVAGIFGGAPSVALASLIVTLVATGAIAVWNEALGMAAGAAALFVWCLLATQAIKRLGSLKGTVVTTSIWLLTAVGLWSVALR